MIYPIVSEQKRECGTCHSTYVHTWEIFDLKRFIRLNKGKFGALVGKSGDKTLKVYYRNNMLQNQESVCSHKYN